ncbi:MAG: RNA polymerase sigma factor [Planctomycetales bacterium]|nr:RNA polymerase sigma factor [Planctomycetales bacterium]
MHDQLPDQLLRVYRFAMHLCRDQHLAEDLAQEAMFRAMRQRDSLHEPRALQVWLLRIVENLWRDWCRCHGKRGVSMLQCDPADAQLEPVEQLSLSDEVERAVAAMNQLPERQRVVLHLIACEELSIAETSEVLQITRQAVRSSLSLARAQMRRMLMPPAATNTEYSSGQEQ